MSLKGQNVPDLLPQVRTISLSLLPSRG